MQKNNAKKRHRMKSVAVELQHPAPGHHSNQLQQFRLCFLGSLHAGVLPSPIILRCITLCGFQYPDGNTFTTTGRHSQHLVRVDPFLTSDMMSSPLQRRCRQQRHSFQPRSLGPRSHGPRAAPGRPPSISSQEQQRLQAALPAHHAQASAQARA